jgi:hypothetical protein
MKLTLFALVAAFFAAGCTNTLYTHHNDFREVKHDGPWAKYNDDIRAGREPSAPKEAKK